MDDLKKVIRGLTCCQTINEYCDECPYNRISYDQCSKAMHKDALKLLKEQFAKDNAVSDKIVRCKDCKYYRTTKCACDGCCFTDDFYCAGGERRDDDEQQGKSD